MRIVENVVGHQLQEQIATISTELNSIRKDLQHLTGKVDTIIALPKEIDHALDRIRTIEKHFGIENDIAA